ncbi:hypothetical protein EW146_g9158 [Bondarzewia mesenterica]|uniref:Serine aminopeptidase S33 domain-containing protein n=1 Tax=Bondarzewia mesenterica TaxID=1095465 RepID=A0A4S4L8S4_9AGAM|nr:hypothetical protein EW146_g9158 [Bondarzewia mesenterica]
MAVTTPFQCLTLSLLLLPPLFITAYFFTQFPHAPEIPYIHPSLASLPRTSKSWDIYSEDFYDGGAYVSLPFGRRTVRRLIIFSTHVKVVLIHGLSVPAMIWRDVAPALASRGYRVLLYDLYGRGYSDAPQVTYDASLYATQLALLMQHVKWDKAFIAGVSMGGGIAAAFNHHFPHLVDGKVALIASAGLIELVRIQSAHLPGYNPALASSLRDGPIRGLNSAFKELGASSHDVLLIWGTADNTVPYKYAARMKALVPQSRLITIQDGGHDLTISHPDTIITALAGFFRAKK